MKRLFALCAAAGALAVAAPALADTIYTDPATGQTYVQSSAPSYVTTPSYATTPFDIITMPVRIIAAPFGAIMQPASGAVGTTSGDLVPVNPHCGVQTDFNGKHTAMCGP